jgi:hypothetical protein
VVIARAVDFFFVDKFWISSMPSPILSYKEEGS